MKIKLFRYFLVILIPVILASIFVFKSGAFFKLGNIKADPVNPTGPGDCNNSFYCNCGGGHPTFCLEATATGGCNNACEQRYGTHSQGSCLSSSVKCYFCTEGTPVGGGCDTSNGTAILPSGVYYEVSECAIKGNFCGWVQCDDQTNVGQFQSRHDTSSCNSSLPTPTPTPTLPNTPTPTPTPTFTPTPTPSNTPTPSITPTPTSTPNYCNGTCGSNYNCQGGLYCYNGFCRNPNCREESDCDCSVSTPTPTPTSTSTPPVLGASTPPELPKTGVNTLSIILGMLGMAGIGVIIFKRFKLV